MNESTETDRPNTSALAAVAAAALVILSLGALSYAYVATTGDQSNSGLNGLGLCLIASVLCFVPILNSALAKPAMIALVAIGCASVGCAVWTASYSSEATGLCLIAAAIGFGKVLQGQLQPECLV